jgi:uncharacterized protein (TIGR02246 family)
VTDVVAAKSEIAAIESLVAQTVACQSDPDRLPALHTENAVIVNIAGRRVLGREDFQSAMTRALNTRLANVRTTAEVADIRFIAPDVALVSCIERVFDENDDAGELPSEGALSYVVQREEGGWRIAFAQTTPIAT